MSAFDLQQRSPENLWSRPASPPPAAAAPVIQRKGSAGGRGAGSRTAAALSHWADAGVAGEGGSLPYADTIQRAFGRHDVSQIRAHTDGDAADAADGLGAAAYAMGNDVAFAGGPDLHTVAHEAAHVVQQRAGVQLLGGIDGGDDAYERHADAVADRVVAGRSAEGLLPEPVAAAATALQRKAIKHELDVDTLETEGADAELSKAQLTSAVSKNNSRWSGRYRAQILAFLHGGEPDEKARFTSGDAQLIAELQAGAGAKADGILGDGTMAVLLNAGFSFSEDVNGGKKLRAGDVVIEFWPGEFEDMAGWNSAISEAESAAVEAGDAAPFRHLEAPEGEGRLYVKVGGKVVAQFRARGGPPRKIVDLGGHTADPTQGSYTIGAQQVGFTTPSWTNSTIPWGAHVRMGTKGYEWQPEGGGAWHTDKAGAIDQDMFGNLPDAGDGTRSYNQNDFGKMAYRLQGSPGFYLHTTPETEQEAALGEEVSLDHSHGCVHLDPSQRDEMIALGYLQPGVRFVCKKYTDHLLPTAARDSMMGK